MNRRRVRAGFVAIAATLVSAGCGASATSPAAATPNDRAACAQLQPAFTALNAGTDGPIPSKAYRRAIAAAAQADNTRLRHAITRWMTTVLGATGAAPGSDATYATEQCRSIGLPLRLHVSSIPTTNGTPSTGSKPPATDPSDEADD